MDSYTPLVKKLLTEAGCSLFRSGKGDHDIWYSPLTKRHFPVDHAIKSRHYREWRVEAGRITESLLRVRHDAQSEDWRIYSRHSFNRNSTSYYSGPLSQDHRTGHLR